MAGRFFPPARGYGATCLLPLSAPIWLPRVKQAHARRCRLSLGWRRSTRACCARVRCAVLVMVGLGVKYLRRTGGRLLSFAARPWCDVSAATSNSKPAGASSKCTRAGSTCLWGVGAALKLAARTRCAALLVVGFGPMKERCTSGRLFSFGSQPWCDVLAAAPMRTRLPREKRTHARRCSLSLG